MTREEAIAYGEECLSWNKFSKGMKMYQFIEMAIQALSQEPMREFTEEEAKAYSKALDKMYKPTGFNVFKEPCDDAISREAVINIVKLRWDYYKNCIEAIEKLPSVTQKSGMWIPVSEPPKELGTYLIQTDGEPYMCKCRWTDVNPFWTDLKTKPHWNIFDLPQYSKVVAWMPLPEPYEPQESEEQTE